MFATLGDLEFTVQTSWDSFTRRRGATFAEHALIERKPRLQWTGDTLDDIRMDVSLHMAHCDPDAEVARWTQAMADHKAMALVLGNGAYLGYYALTEVSEATRHCDPVGTTVSCDLSITLREAPEDDQVAPPAPAVQPANTPITATNSGSNVANSAATAAGDAAQVGAVVSAAGQAQATTRQAADAADIARGVAASNEAAAMSQIPALLSSVARVTGALATLHSAANAMASHAEGAQIAGAAQTALGAARSAQTALAGVDASTVAGGLDYTSTKLGAVSAALAGAATPLAGLAARITTRSAA